MLPIPDIEVYGGLVALALICLPLGAVVLRIAEWFVGRPVKLTVCERLLLAFYATGGVLFVLASIPAPLYGLSGVVGLLAVGAIGYAVLSLRERARGLASTVRWLMTWPGLLVSVLTLGLLAVEVIGGSVVLPNGIDGAVDSLYVNRLLALHTIPWTLQPYASVGVTYPQGTPVWFSLPVLLFGWPTLSAPVVLPPLFLSLTPAAAYSLGGRVGGLKPSSTPWMGILFAAFFGLVASWPRLYVGGSFDFVLAMPLFLLTLGLLLPFARSAPSWRMAVAFGVLLGTAAVVGAAVGLALGLLLLAYWVLASATSGIWSLSRLAQVLASLGVALVCLVRSMVGIAVWWSYPGHVMTDNAVPPYAPIVNRETYTGLLSQIDPFTPWKAKVSPFPFLSVELQVLLVGGLVLSALVLTGRLGSLREYLSAGLVEWTLVGAATLLVVTVIVGALGEWNTSLSGIQSVTNLNELSILLFLFYSLIALLPLVAGVNYLRTHRGSASGRPTPGRSPSLHPRVSFGRFGSSRRRWTTVVAVGVLVVPLASGVAVTTAIMPGYLHTFLRGQSNGTQEDVTVLEWAGEHLPSCSGVLAAPGSAAQFLPEFATLRIIYPVFPVPANLTYFNVVQNLSNGTYGPTTREGMLMLGVTEVFVTGATTNTYPAFSLVPLRAAPSAFTLLDSSGDAFLFAFNPGIVSENCPPT